MNQRPTTLRESILHTLRSCVDRATDTGIMVKEARYYLRTEFDEAQVLAELRAMRHDGLAVEVPGVPKTWMATS